MTRRKTTIAYVKSSGNVFADLGLPHPERALLKAGLKAAPGTGLLLAQLISGETPRFDPEPFRADRF